MQQKADIAILQAQLTDVQDRLDAIQKLLMQNSQTEGMLGDWVDENTAIAISGLKKSSLFALRKAGKLTSSTISAKGVFYRRSDFERLLNDNEKNS